MATDLGKVGMRARGNWNSLNTYEVLDVVSYNNGLYLAVQAVPANTVPTNTTYWQQCVAIPTPRMDNTSILTNLAANKTGEPFTVTTSKFYRVRTNGSGKISISTSDSSLLYTVYSGDGGANVAMIYLNAGNYTYTTGTNTGAIYN
ncbi:MAG: hypothetical protein IKS98_00965 [Lachnospiraceae bacterium]|nr:hypothetical protein [Lachnospiraceae bacterium]